MSIKKGTMPPRYDEAFKAGAVKMVTEQGRPICNYVFCKHFLELKVSVNHF